MTTIHDDFASGRAASPGWMSRLSQRLFRRMAARWLAGGTMRDLAELDDHILHDIGIARDQIRELAARDAQRAAAGLRVPFAPLL